MQDVLHATRSVILLTDADGVILVSFGAQRYSVMLPSETCMRRGWGVSISSLNKMAQFIR